VIKNTHNYLERPQKYWWLDQELLGLMQNTLQRKLALVVSMCAIGKFDPERIRISDNSDTQIDITL
jgi:hypothetical protein